MCLVQVHEALALLQTALPTARQGQVLSLLHTAFDLQQGPTRPGHRVTLPPLEQVSWERQSASVQEV